MRFCDDRALECLAITDEYGLLLRTCQCRMDQGPVQ
jgi:hypothetical protein